MNNRRIFRHILVVVFMIIALCGFILGKISFEWFTAYNLLSLIYWSLED